MMRRALLVPVLTLLTVSATPVPPTPGGWRHDRPREAFAEVGLRPEFASVARLVRDGSTRRGGSGVLVAPSWVLTAAHVVDTWRPGDDYVWEWQGASAPVADVVIHPAYPAATLDERVDLALVRLEHPVSSPAPAALHVEGTEQGRRMVLIGFGTTQPANSLGGNGDQMPPGEKYGGFNVADSVGALHLFFDMDAPTMPELNALGAAEPDSLEYIPLGGDSGGGVFSRVDGTWELVAINGTVTFDLSHVDRYGWYGVVGRLNRVAPQVAWIRSVLGS